MDRAKGLIAKLVANADSSETDGTAYQLLTEYQRGSPIESLRVLLSSPDDRLVGEGTWIASELPEKGRLLLPDMKGLLKHRSKKVRFWALDCVLLWAGAGDGELISAAISLIDDREQAVRWKALGFISLASHRQLEAALSSLKAANPGSAFIDELEWMQTHSENKFRELTAGLLSHEPLRRRFAAAAAFRAVKIDPEPLHLAVSSSDPEIAQFAADMLERVRLFPPRN